MARTYSNDQLTHLLERPVAFGHEVTLAEVEDRLGIEAMLQNNAYTPRNVAYLCDIPLTEWWEGPQLCAAPCDFVDIFGRLEEVLSELDDDKPLFTVGHQNSETDHTHGAWVVSGVHPDWTPRSIRDTMLRSILLAQKSYVFPITSYWRSFHTGEDPPKSLITQSVDTNNRYRSDAQEVYP